MGLIGKILGGGAGAVAVGDAVTGVAEVFLPNATKKMEAAQEAYMAALEEHGDEFRFVRPGRFDRFVNGLNRMPRPMLALGTLGLFVFAMIDPVRFAERMVGLAYVPEPLWWLLGAIVGFYFGAREAHYLRAIPRRVRPTRAAAPPAPAAVSGDTGANPALSEWRRRDSDR